MEAPHVHIVRHNGYTVECYGTLEEDSNFHVICRDEDYDDAWCEGNPEGDGFTDWEEVVECLQPHFHSRIIEIGAC